MVSPFGNPQVSDLIPHVLTSIDILELNQNLQVLVQENIAGSFGNGSTFSYTSVAALPGQIVKPVDIPRAIQLNIIGLNKFDQPIINVYLITFSNNCGQYPVLFDGQYAGWTRFVSSKLKKWGFFATRLLISPFLCCRRAYSLQLESTVQ
jgi:hypothetical protein